MNSTKKKKGIVGMAVSFGLNNLLAVVLCLLIMSLFSFVLNSDFAWIMYCLMLFVCAFLIYHQAWQYGGRDKDNNYGNRVKTAVFGSLVASAPTFIMAIFSILIDFGMYTPTFTITNQATVIAAYRFWNMPFRIIFDYLETVPALYFLPCIVIPIFATLGYVLGHKQIKIVNYVYYAKDKEE